MLRSCSFTVLHLANNSGTVPPRSATLDKLSRALPTPARGKLGKIDLNILNVMAYLDRGANPNPLPVILVFVEMFFSWFFVIFFLLFLSRITRYEFRKSLQDMYVFTFMYNVYRMKLRRFCIIIGGGVGNEKEPIKKWIVCSVLFRTI